MRKPVNPPKIVAQPYIAKEPDDHTMMEACRAVVAAEQDQWELPASEWDSETFKIHGIWNTTKAAIIAAAGWNGWML